MTLRRMKKTWCHFGPHCKCDA